MNNASGTCGCGHDRGAHTHYRPGSDCGACGQNRCASFELAASDDAHTKQASAVQRVLSLLAGQN